MKKRSALYTTKKAIVAIARSVGWITNKPQPETLRIRDALHATKKDIVNPKWKDNQAKKELRNMLENDHNGYCHALSLEHKYKIIKNHYVSTTKQNSRTIWRIWEKKLKKAIAWCHKKSYKVCVKRWSPRYLSCNEYQNILAAFSVVSEIPLWKFQEKFQDNER